MQAAVGFPYYLPIAVGLRPEHRRHGEHMLVSRAVEDVSWEMSRFVSDTSVGHANKAVASSCTCRCCSRATRWADERHFKSPRSVEKQVACRVLEPVQAA